MTDTNVTDPNVEAVRARLIHRSSRGLLKYGTTTDRPDYELIDWCMELQDELLDAAVYLEAAMRKIGEQKP